MANMSPSVDLRTCAKIEEPHPCDTQKPCDPFEEDEGDCLTPFICLEKIKNPAFPGETTKCKTGNYMNVKSCAKKDPTHPCDPLPPCCAISIVKTKQKKPCKEPTLCFQRIKNPDMTKKLMEPCDPDK